MVAGVLVDGDVTLAAGGTVTEYSPTAKAQLGQWDSQFDDDYDTWLKNQPPPCENC